MSKKVLMTLFTFAAISSYAFGDFVVTPASVSVPGPNVPVSGSEYFISPGIGNAGGFFFSGAFDNAVVDGAVDDIGVDVAGGTVFAADTLIDNGDGTLDIVLTLFSSAGELFPAGFTDGAGGALDSAALFLGATGGGAPLATTPNILNDIEVELFDITGTSVAGPFDLSSPAFGGVAADGSFSGSLGVSFGAGTTGLGIFQAVVTINVTAIPEPASAAILSVIGLGLVTRRRR